MSGAYFSLLRERGAAWFINRSLYSMKLKLMCTLPATEKLFEKKIPPVCRVDAYHYDIKALKAFLLGLSDTEKQEIIHRADEAANGRIKGFSAVEMDYGSPVNWQLDPITGNSCRADLKWYKIPDFDEKRGDIKSVWEISRFSHFFTFARAFLLTGDKKYYTAFSQQLAHWLECNPYSFGANFKCGQECALRMMTALLVYPVFAGEADKQDEDNLKELVFRCYKKILSNFFYARRCIRNNHTISELAGMMAGAWCCKDQKRLNKAYKLIDKVIAEQFTADGGYIQQSFNYQRLALQDMEAILCLSHTTGKSLSAASLVLIDKSVKLMYQCMDESGDMPNYGFNDGALIFPVTACGYRDFRPVVNTVYALLHGKRLFDPGLYDEELLWFSQSVAPQKGELQRCSSAFPQAGIYTLRRGGRWLMISAKENINHMDQNHLDFWLDGVNVFCDSGTYSYSSELGRLLQSAAGHNTAVCGDKPQVFKIGSFAVYGQPKLVKRSFDNNSFSSETAFSSGYAHKRTVSLSENGFSVEDEVLNSGGQCEILFHTPCTVEGEGGSLVLSYGGRRLCRFESDAPHSVHKAQRSLYYLTSDSIVCIALPVRDVKIKTKITFM